MTDELKQWEYDRGYEKGKADVLDKIRDEIKQYQSHLQEGCIVWNELEKCLRIIDKYRKEQE